MDPNEFPIHFAFTLPPWVASLALEYQPAVDLKARMDLVVRAAGRNVLERTGGPFAAAVFEVATGRLVALGVNRVTTEQCSLLHAEVVAIALAQRALGAYDLGAAGLPDHELVTSTEPCAMCLGAIPWSGVRRLVCGARDEDARAVGFDEGAKPIDWPESLRARGIEVLRDVARDDAAAVLRDYAREGGLIYNPECG